MKLALLILLLAALCGCHRDSWHWVQQAPPIGIKPHVAPPTPTVSLLPTITPDGR